MVVAIVGILLLAGILGIGGVGWFLYKKGLIQITTTSSTSTPTQPPTAPEPPQPNVPEPAGDVPITPAAGGSIIHSENFDSPAGPVVEGEGQLANLPGDTGNRVWKITGDAESYVSLPLPVTPGSGKILVSYQVYIPSTTVIESFDGQQMKGVRVRTRLTDRLGSSAIFDAVLSPADSWQQVNVTFDDGNSAPYDVGIEMIWFQGPIYIDTIEVRTDTAPTGTVSPTPPETKNVPGETTEQWIERQPWLATLRKSMPAGVTVSVSVEPGAADGWDSIEIREHHSPVSGFDPNVSPMIGMFRLSPDRNTLEYLDPVSGEYGSIQPFLQNWNLL